MVILGIDPGLRATGFGLITACQDKLAYVTSGVICADSDQSLGERLCDIFESVHALVEKYQPTEACIEKVFVNVNPQSTLLLGQARGSAICAMATKKLLVEEYTALQIKQAVVGHGHAQKEQVQSMVQRLLALDSPPSADAADALACAICHAFHKNNPMLVNSARGYRMKRGRLLV